MFYTLQYSTWKKLQVWFMKKMHLYSFEHPTSDYIKCDVWQFYHTRKTTLLQS